jgi:hypothetical protein
MDFAHLIRRRALRVLLVLLALCLASPAVAGAPFFTDDPQTPASGHFEFDIAARLFDRAGETAGVLPYVEVDYGRTDRLAAHALIANAFDHTAGDGTRLGFGDAELGAKYRFIGQGEGGSPVAAAIYPTILAPSGDSTKGLSDGHIRVFLPLWMQRNLGEWAVFGGGGYWINTGTELRNSWFFGLGALRPVTENLSLGGEIFHATPDRTGAVRVTGFNLGAAYELGTDHRHRMLVAAGSGILKRAMADRLTVFLGYQLTP